MTFEPLCKEVCVLSYHLRQLARYGFIVEDSARGTGRDRWWRAAHTSTEFDLSLPGQAGEGQVYEDAVVTAMSSAVARARAGRADLPAEWQRVFDVSDVLLRLTPEEATGLAAELLAVLRRYRPHRPPDPGPPGSRLVQAQFQIFPVPASPALGEP